MKENNVLIIGAGLCGALLALRLGQRGFKVAVYEKRSDLRISDVSSGRSINLALSDRGIKAMRLVGIEDQVNALCIPMYGRQIHDKSGNTFLSRYSGRQHEYINSISRDGLNGLLLNEAEKLSGVTFSFDSECLDVNFETASATFQTPKGKITQKADVIFGADGVGSILRRDYFLERKFLFSFSQNFLTHGYKELEIPSGDKNSFQISENALHIWPRGNYMLIALPNLNGSFTVTLFLSYEDDSYNFNNLNSAKEIKSFFENEFPDVLELMPNLIRDFKNNPTAPLGTIKCSPWHYKGNTLLIGDAAHAIVPFYGQGMNACFEDVVILDSILDRNYTHWESVFKAYEKERKQDTDAIADLALDNFIEMRHHTAKPIFQEKRKFEMAFEEQFPDQYTSKYSLVTFNENIGYYDALIRGRAQDKALLNLIADQRIHFKANFNTDELREILKLVIKETDSIIEDDVIAKTVT